MTIEEKIKFRIQQLQSLRGQVVDQIVSRDPNIMAIDAALDELQKLLIPDPEPEPQGDQSG